MRIFRFYGAAPFGSAAVHASLGGYSLETILAWDIDRIVMAHGTICATGGRAALKHACDWLLR